LGRRLLLWFVCALAASLALVPPALALDEAAPTTPAPSYLPGRIIVVWEEDASRGEKSTAKHEAEVDSGPTLGDPSFQVVEVEPGQSTTGAIAELASSPAVAVVERDAYFYPAAVPNDPLFGKLWALENTGAGVDGFVGAVAGDDINATAAWDVNAGLPGTVVADIDGGYRFAGEELGTVAVPGFDFVGSDADSPTQDSDPTDDNLFTGGHGVHTAGTIGAAGNNGIGITGAAQNVRIMPLRVCAAAPSEDDEPRCPGSSIVAAINYAGSHGAQVANISLTSTVFSASMREALAKSPQTLFVAAAGNDSVSNDSGGKHHYPCDYRPGVEVAGAVENVVCVAATDQADGLAGFSDWGPSSVDLGAPGTEILSTYSFDDVLGIEGENFAAEDFAAKWTSGADGGFGRTSEEPLTSAGIADSPEQDPVADSVRESVLSAAVPVPAGYTGCRFTGRRFVSLGSGIFTQEISREGTPVFTSQPPNTTGSKMIPFSTVPINGIAGSSIKIRFRYEAGATPGASDGVWLDDLALTCAQPTSAAPAYAFLEGTSMAAPQVSGAAALIFSQYPGAPVTAVRNALLGSVEPLPSLQGKTVTGGRLDALAALLALDTTPPVNPVLATDPASPGTSPTPRIIGSAEPGSTVRLFANANCSGAPISQLSAAALSSPGVTVSIPSGTTLAFSATATDAALNVSGCTAVSYTNVSALSGPPNGPLVEPPVESAACTVPKLVGKSLAQAKAALTKAACRTGKVTKPRIKPGQKPTPLVVKSSSPVTGAKPPSGVVALKLGPKPRARHRRHN
jgi:thermitase